MANVMSSTETGKERGLRDRRLGTVVSDGRDKTIKVRFDYRVKHPKYGKYMRRATTMHAHDEKNEAKMGDIVEVVGCRRISKTKCWRLTHVVRAAGSSALVE